MNEKNRLQAQLKAVSILIETTTDKNALKAYRKMRKDIKSKLKEIDTEDDEA